jgi:hypothetical protein
MVAKVMSCACAAAKDGAQVGDRERVYRFFLAHRKAPDPERGVRGKVPSLDGPFQDQTQRDKARAHGTF